MKQLAVDLVILNERRSSYVQDLQIAIETLVRASQSRPQPGAERPAGPRFRAARRSHSGGDARPSEFRRARRSAGAAWRALRAARAHRGASRVGESRAEARRRAFAAAVAASPSRPRILQRARRLRARRRGICDDPRAGPIDAGALDQRDRQSGVRLPGGNRGRRLHLVGQQPREPAHAVVERPRQRSRRRSFLSAGRRHRRLVEPDGAARSATRRRPTSPATAADTADSSMSRTASRPIFCNTFRSTRRSRFRASC